MICFDEKKLLFHLRNAHISCVLSLRKDKTGRAELLMPYFGAPIDDADHVLTFIDEQKRASFDTERQLLPYACPTDARGDYRPAMLRARDEQGQRLTELFYDGYAIEMGKRPLDGLPATYVENKDEAETLFITLSDPLTGLTATLSYTLFTEHAVMATSMTLVNAGEKPLTLENAASVCLALEGRYDMIHLHGAWARERQVERAAPACFCRMIESVRGASGHEHNPFAALARPDATESAGECIGVNLVYSGDFRLCADENAYGCTRLVAGLNPRAFEWRLNPGERFQTPEAVVVYSASGINAMSQTFHALYRTRLCRGYWRDRERPILINNWEATYFEFDHASLTRIARAAADLGVELFVLDDGWFGKRKTDNCSLGDWTENTEKLPRGLKDLAEEINVMGMRFGLWFEPEMVSPDSDLYRAHPDWCLHAEGRGRTQARNQLILDLTRSDVQDYIVKAVSKVLSGASIGYVKWDMNRNFTEAGSGALANGRQGETHHRYMLGLYRVLERITTAFPEVLFESCSGGGGRFDPGMLFYMPQTWTSDDTDAVERARIQYGTSLCYPVSAMGAHVSAVPNHQLERVTDMRTRGEVALAGNFGFELDLSAQTSEDIEEIRRLIQTVKRVRGTVQKGAFTRLISPFEGEIAAWQFADEKRLILCAYLALAHANSGSARVRARGLKSGDVYIGEDGARFSADTLMNAGLAIDMKRDFSSRVMVFEKI